MRNIEITKEERIINDVPAGVSYKVVVVDEYTRKSMSFNLVEITYLYEEIGKKLGKE